MAAPAPVIDDVGNSSGHHGLTTAQKVGVAVAVAAVVVIGFLCLVIYIRRKRRQQQPHAVVVDTELAAHRATAAGPAPSPLVAVVVDTELAAHHATAAAPAPPPLVAVVVDTELAAPRATAAAPAPPPLVASPPASSSGESAHSEDSWRTFVVHSVSSPPVLNLGAASTRFLNLDYDSTSSGDGEFPGFVHSGVASPTTVFDLHYESASSDE